MPAFAEPLRLYEEWYTEYFRVFCDVRVGESEAEKQAAGPMEALSRCSSTAWPRPSVDTRHAAGPCEKLARGGDSQSDRDTQKLRVLFAEVHRTKNPKR